MGKFAEHINIKDRIITILKKHPFEWFSIIGTAYSTFKYRVVCRCTKAKSIVGVKTRIINYSRVRIGTKCLILDNVYLRAGIHGSIVIGDHCAINSFAKLFGHGGISIREYTQIGPNTLLTTTTHNYKESMATSFKEINIGKWVWIGAGVIILPGVTIGDYAVIGAGTIVNKDIPPYAVAVGNPARVIGENEKAKAENLKSNNI